VPVGWSFDYKDTDHHIDEHSFSIRNDRYTSSSGKFRFTASLNYSDKNRDDDYSWRYDVALIATNQGDKRVHEPGVYHDGGGIDSESFSVDLDALFSPITWTNGVMDGDETGVDSGGNSPARNLGCAQSTNVNPGNASSSAVFNLKTSADRATLMTFANNALHEYYHSDTWGTPNPDFDTFYSGPTKGDRYVEAVAWWVNEHMEWVEDGGDWDGKQKALRTLLESGHRGGGDFNGDCEDHAILRAALLRVLGFKYTCIFCADHHNSVDQGQREEAGSTGKKKNSGGHTYNVVVYQGKYRILDYGPMQVRNWSNCWDQHATDNIWNDHTGEHWSSQDVTPFGGSEPLVNYPGNPSSPTSNWDWRTYFNDISP
jgi:hypothetical protein